MARLVGAIAAGQFIERGLDIARRLRQHAVINVRELVNHVQRLAEQLLLVGRRRIGRVARGLDKKLVDAVQRRGRVVGPQLRRTEKEQNECEYNQTE